MQRRQFLAGAAAVAGASFLPSGQANALARQSDLVIVAGQSNANSAGTVGTDDVPDYFREPDPGVKIWSAKRKEFQVYKAGINSHNDQSEDVPQQWGPEAEFSRKYRVKFPDRDLYIVKRAKGSTFLSHDHPDRNWDWSPADHGGYYDQLLGAYRDAISALQDQANKPNVISFLWMQGETDAGAVSTASAYEENLRGFIARVRADFKTPRLRFVIGRIYDIHNWTYNAAVRKAQVDVATSDMNAAWVDTDDFDFAPDHVHYNPAGVIALGGRMFDASLVS